MVRSLLYVALTIETGKNGGHSQTYVRHDILENFVQSRTRQSDTHNPWEMTNDSRCEKGKDF